MQSKKYLPKIDSDLVIEIICGYLKLDENRIFEKGKDDNISHARFLSFFFLNRIFKMEHSETAKIFDVSVKLVWYGCDKILTNIVLYRESKQEYNDIRKLIMKRLKDIIIIPEAQDIKP